jgi:hypothetical protein
MHGAWRSGQSAGKVGEGEGGFGSGPAVLLAHNRVPAREPSRAAPLAGAADAGALARAHRGPIALRSLVVLPRAGP